MVETEEKQKYPLSVAEPLAESILKKLKPHCEIIVIVGSVKRGRWYTLVGDIEFVLTPKTRRVKRDLFTASVERTPGFLNAVYDIGPRIIGNPVNGKLMSRRHTSGIHVEIFIANAKNWGYIVMLRTGPASFGKQMFGIDIKKRGYYCKDGFIYRACDSIRMDTPTEESVFELLGIDYIQPEFRL